MTPAQKHGPIPLQKCKVGGQFLINLFNEKEKEEELKNPLALNVNTTSSESMTQSVFFDYCLHFVQSLPDHQGKGKFPCILILDGHVSSWNVAALRFLIMNNVYPFSLASHTTIWSQPNDNGPIK